MNVQAHMSGQRPGQASNQLAPNQLTQQNGVSINPAQMQNLVPAGVGPRGVAGCAPNNIFMDQNLRGARQIVRDKIYGMITQRHGQPVSEQQKQRFNNLCARIEDGLFKLASDEEEYMNLSTLESRLGDYIKLSQTNGSNQRRVQYANSIPAIGAMIPTPRMSNGGNSNATVTSVDTMMVISSGFESTTSPAINTGSLIPTGGIHGRSLNRSAGTLGNGYQQSQANISITSGENMASMGEQKMNQMIPTPGFTNSSSSSSSSSNNPLYPNIEPLSSSGGYSSIESTMLSQPQQQKQYVGGQNSHVMQSLGSHMGAGARSDLQRKSYGFSTGTLNGGLEIMTNNLQVKNEPITSESYLPATSYASCPRLLQQNFDQHQQQPVQGDGCGISDADSFGSGNFYSRATSAGLIMNAQGNNSVNFQSISKRNSLVNNQPNLPGIQHGGAHVRSQLVNQHEKLSFQSQLSLRDDTIQSNQQQKLLQQPNQFQPMQSVQKQSLLKQQPQQHHHLFTADTLVQSQMPNPSIQVKCEPGVDHHMGVMHPQSAELYQIPELQNQFQQKFMADNSSDVQNLSKLPGQNSMCQSLAQTPKLLQEMLDSQQLVSESQNKCHAYSVGMQSVPVIQGQWNTQSQDRTAILDIMVHEQHVQGDFQKRISEQGEGAHNNLPTERSIDGHPGKASKPQNAALSKYRSGILNRDQEFRDQKRWLLFLFHARRCKSPEGKCPYVHCITVRHLLRHTEICSTSPCQYPRCQLTRSLLTHYKNCTNAVCPVCIPVKNYIHQQMALLSKARASTGLDSGLPNKADVPGDYSSRLISKTSTAEEAVVQTQPSMKRMKIEKTSRTLKPETESSAINDCHVALEIEQQQDNISADVSMAVKSEFVEIKPKVLASSSNISDKHVMGDDDMENGGNRQSDGECTVDDVPSSSGVQKSVKLEKETDLVKQENAKKQSDHAAGTKSGKPAIKGVSMIELFTPEQVREHICGLRQWIGQSKAKAEKNQALGHSMSENSCQLCAVEKLTFEPPPIYCSICGSRIKRNAMYYTVGAGEGRHYFCIPCYNESRGETITVEATSIAKARLEKKKNDEETEEWWVQCDKCEAWQHQICALFNGRRNDGGQAEYTCPHCYVAEVERGERTPLPTSAVLGAKDLPRSILSDHIEQRLFRKLKEERQERAKLQGKSYDEVPGAEALVVRVVSSVDKKLEVKPRFYETFREENYPVEFPYKSKVVLLFQKIEGVEVCLFGMYVQEFGSESQFPNQRRVYLSYLDSVKYFRPEIKAVTGEALRTFVYHEILIGYLEYCKMRGFTSFYIWACPPLKGEDYILYCHPEIQKTPKSDKLREWYLSMLRKATTEKIVVELTNFYDHFFVSNGECKAKVTAARLPYFDGDYWPGAAEDLIYQLNQEEDGRKQNKKGTTKKTITKRALKAAGQSDLSGNASKDLLLMHKLGETISPMKEDFIMVHLQHCCTHCCILMVSGNRWVCKRCKNFQICDECFEVEQKREERERHPVNHRDKHVLYPVEITDVPSETKDKDEIVESEFFDTRQAFLSLCQGNHYQYDTLRRAKHSSMMVLYHLHNPTAPAFVSTCVVCHLDVETGQGWRCDVCPEYEVCNSCFQKGGIDHPHKLTNYPSTADRDAQNKEARQMRVAQLRIMLDLLVHASQCRSGSCQYPNCRKVKALFHHGLTCKKRVSGGCVLCKRMWYLLQLHARACKESNCRVPRCRDLKEHLRRMQQQSDSRRRAAVMEMMRQRAAEVAGSSG